MRRAGETDVEVIAPLTPSSRSVFRDLGFGAGEAEKLKLRSTLIGHIRRRMKSRGLTQSEAARAMQVSQRRRERAP
ncbi:MAG: XRE family transcriptional regulator [Acidobacteria bacterium]|nr:XRE family transcriptional regulator [Acidobacteriota bacterium]